MTPKPVTKKLSARPPSNAALSHSSLWETLADTRLQLQFLQQRAREANDKALVNTLTSQITDLRKTISTARKKDHKDWTSEASTLVPQLIKAQSRLQTIIHQSETDQKWIRTLTRTLGAVDNILTLARRVI